jgi:DNA repair photolyase
MKTTTRKGSFIKQFDGAGENNIVCFRFWQAVIASGCPGECSYCFLQTSPAYVFNGEYDLMGTLFDNLRDIVPQTRAWLRARREPTGIVLGETQDGIAFEHPYKRHLGVTPLELLIPLFEGENPLGHTLVVLSKFVGTRYAEAFGPQRNVVYSWSLSLPSISERYERKVSPLMARVVKAHDLKREGYRVRFRLDALAPVEGWEEELRRVIDLVNEVGPEMLTIGALRATNPTALRRAAERNGRDASIFDHLATVDPSNFKHRTSEEFHTAAFMMIRERLAPGIALGLCKEDVSMWRSAGVGWQGCHCLHGAADAVTTPRLHLIEGLSRR